jgi:uncharacterized membrane protein
MTTYTADPHYGRHVLYMVLLSIAVVFLSVGWLVDHVTLKGKVDRLTTEIDHWLSTDLAKERFAAEKLRQEVESLKSQIRILSIRERASGTHEP